MCEFYNCIARNIPIKKLIIFNGIKNWNIITTVGDVSHPRTGFFKLRKFEYNKTKYHNIVIDTLDAAYSEKLYKGFEELPEPTWHNPYACT